MNDSQKQILDFILKHPKVCDAWVTTQGRLKGKYKIGKTGVSDIIGFLNDGRFLAIEIKKKGEKVSESQELFINKVNNCGGVAGIAIVIEDANNILNERG
jgi:RecB family endonuclease NucS